MSSPPPRPFGNATENQLKALQFRYRDAETGGYRGGLVVSDAIARRNASLMFRQ